MDVMGDDRARIADAVKTSHLFEDMDAGAVERLIDAATIEKFDSGQVILEEGTVGDDLFLILFGTVEVSIHVEGGEKKLAQMTKGDVFGEIAGLIDHHRYATVTAIGPTRDRRRAVESFPERAVIGYVPFRYSRSYSFL